MKKKYTLTHDMRVFSGYKVYRIKSLRDFSNVKKGELGGYVQNERNLSHDGDCWIYKNIIDPESDDWFYSDPIVFDDARVFENAKIYEHARLYGGSCIYGDAIISGNTTVCIDVHICGTAYILGDANIHGKITIDSGIWNHVKIGNKRYLISTTLQKIYLERK